MFKLFYNAHIHTLNQSNQIVNCILVSGDRIILCGNIDDINLPDKLVKKYNLQGKTVVPSFIDCHTHIAMVAKKQNQVNLDNCPSLQHANEIISDFVRHMPENTWIRGGGWDANIWRDQKPHKKYLDAITHKHPIALYSKDVHTVWVNSAALRLAGIDNLTSDPPGGKIEKDEQGETTGLLYESCWNLIEKIIPSITYQDFEKFLNLYSHKLYGLGITSLHSCDTYDDFSFFQQLALNKKLPLRICMHPPVSAKDNLIAAKLSSGFGDEWLRLGGLKYFVDGSLGSQTAEMFEKYNNMDHAGIEVISAEQLNKDVVEAARNRLSATIHAIGDKANFKALEAIALARQVSQPIQLRHRIEHAQTIRKQDFVKFDTNSVIASMQPFHIIEDIKLADHYLGNRTTTTYAIQTLLNHNVRVVFGSDMPVADPDPLKGIRAAISRRYLLSRDEPKWHPEQCISVFEAVKAYTREAAFAGYDEHVKGSLEPGKLADFVVLSDNIFDSEEESLDNVKVVQTVLGGGIVFQENF